MRAMKHGMSANLSTSPNCPYATIASVRQTGGTNRFGVHGMPSVCRRRPSDRRGRPNLSVLYRQVMAANGVNVIRHLVKNHVTLECPECKPTRMGAGSDRDPSCDTSTAKSNGEAA